MQFTYKTTNRNPFKTKKLPLIAILYNLGYRKQRGAYKSLIGKPAKALFKFLHKTIGLRGTGRMTISNGKDIPFDARNTQFHAIYLPHFIDNYETEVSSLIDTLLPDHGTFVDAGANWGYFSLYAASREDFHGHIHAFEPVKNTFDSLSQTVAESGYNQVITCHQTALSDSVSTKSMQIEDSIHSGIASISNDNMGTDIQCITLDSLSINNIDFIKIDVEGHEAEMLRGAEGCIRQSKPFIVFENWLDTNNQDDTLSALVILSEFGYHFFHPAWLQAGRTQPTIDPPKYKSGDIIEFVLTGFSLEQRHLLKKQINIFACHKDRIDQLYSVYTPRGEGSS